VSSSGCQSCFIGYKHSWRDRRSGRESWLRSGLIRLVANIDGQMGDGQVELAFALLGRMITT
jgi:hypothetical protein